MLPRGLQEMAGQDDEYLPIRGKAQPADKADIRYIISPMAVISMPEKFLDGEHYHQPSHSDITPTSELYLTPYRPPGQQSRTIP